MVQMKIVSASTEKIAFDERDCNNSLDPRKLSHNMIKLQLDILALLKIRKQLFFYEKYEIERKISKNVRANFNVKYHLEK